MANKNPSPATQFPKNTDGYRSSKPIRFKLPDALVAMLEEMDKDKRDALMLEALTHELDKSRSRKVVPPKSGGMDDFLATPEATRNRLAQRTPWRNKAK